MSENKHTPEPVESCDTCKNNGGTRGECQNESCAYEPKTKPVDVELATLRKQRDELLSDAQRYRWLRIHGLQRAWVSLGTDCDGENFAQFKCEFKVPEPPNLPYEDEEGFEWADKDFDAAIDAAIAGVKGINPVVKESLTTETTAPAIVFYPAGSLGEEVQP